MASTTLSLAKIALVTALGSVWVDAYANCWSEVSATYNVPVPVLAAIAKHESGFNPRAVHVNADSSRDLGLMQINDSHLPALARFGIKERDLFDACTNLRVAGWIVASNANRLGWNWDAIGAYNVGCKKLSKEECGKRRASYAWKIHSQLRLLSRGGEVSPAAQPAKAVGNPLVVDYIRASSVTSSYAAPRPITNTAAVPIRNIQVANLDPDSVSDDRDEEVVDWYENPEAGDE